MSRRSNRASKAAAAGREMERLSLVRNEYLREVLAEVSEHKDRFISDERLYTMEIPTCGSGGVQGALGFDELEIHSEAYIRVRSGDLWGWLDAAGNLTTDKSQAFYGSWYDAEK